MVGLGMAGRDGECGEDPRVRASGPNSITFSILNLLLTPPLPALQTPFYSPRSPFFLFPSPRPSTLPAFVFFLLPAPPHRPRGSKRASSEPQTHSFLLEPWLPSLRRLCFGVGPQFADAALLPPGGRMAADAGRRAEVQTFPPPGTDERKTILLAARLLEIAKWGWD